MSEHMDHNGLFARIVELLDPLDWINWRNKLSFSIARTALENKENPLTRDLKSMDLLRRPYGSAIARVEVSYGLVEVRITFAPTEALAARNLPYLTLRLEKYGKFARYGIDDLDYYDYPDSLRIVGGGPEQGASEDQVQGMIWILQQCEAI